MARKIDRLSALRVCRANKSGHFADGGGLYLQVSDTGTKSWVFRYRTNGRLREMGLGAIHTVSLAEARQRASHCRKLRLDGIDPIEARKRGRLHARILAAREMTFEQCAKAYIEAHSAAWKNEKHKAQWSATLRTYAYPIFGHLPVQSIDISLIAKVLEPLWKKKTETASRLRGRIERVLDWATVRGYRQGDNPARWRGHLENLLPRRSKVQKVQHHPALPYSDIGQFITSLREEQGTAPRALEFLILTATRTSEVTGATWTEIDLVKAVWTIPASRIKAGKEHRVPLSRPALSILRRLDRTQNNQFVFSGLKPSQPLSNMAMLQLLSRMGRTDLTVHGFRSTFRDWAAESTNFPREVAEQALAHSLRDKVEAAYRRGDLFDKRRQMMDAWARYCSAKRTGSTVIPIRARPKQAALR